MPCHATCRMAFTASGAFTSIGSIVMPARSANA